MLKVIDSPADLVEAALSDSDYIDRFCAGCEMLVEEYGCEDCEAFRDPADSRCLYNSFLRARLAEIRAAQRIFDEAISYVPSDDREGYGR